MFCGFGCINEKVGVFIFENCELVIVCRALLLAMVSICDMRPTMDCMTNS